jgi:hypothetical protein
MLLLKLNKAATNSTFAIGGVLCSADSFVVTESSVLRINICLKSLPIANLQTLAVMVNNNLGNMKVEIVKATTTTPGYVSLLVNILSKKSTKK